MGFTYNGIHSDDMGITVRSSPSILPPIKTKMQSVPGRPGAYYQKSERGPRPIKKEVGFIADDFRDYYQRLRDLAAWLYPKDEQKALVDDDEPDKAYYVVLDGSTDLERLARLGKGTLSFIAYNPDAEGDALLQTIHNPAQPGLSNVINNPGTAETFPLFRATVLKPSTFLAIANGDQYVQVGQPAGIEDTEVDRHEVILRDLLSSTNGWAVGNYIDGGTVTGTMISENTKFTASDFGTGSAWHGPALRTALPQQVQDFIVEAHIYTSSQFTRQVGRTEIYLFGPNDEQIGKMAMKDTTVNSERNHGEIRAGSLSFGHHLINRPDSAWDKFNNGIVRIERHGNRWKAYIADVDPDTGRQYSRLHGSWTDRDGDISAALASVQIHVGQYGDYSVPTLAAGDITVWQINEVGTEQVPIIFAVDDVVELDHKEAKVYKNGEPWMDEYDIDSQFFKLNPGPNVVGVVPEDVAKIDAIYRPAWL